MVQDLIVCAVLLVFAIVLGEILFRRANREGKK